MSKNRSKSRITLWVLLAVLTCAVLGGAAYGVLGWYIPYRDAENTMPQDGIMLLQEQEDGSLLLTWPEGSNADSYTLDVLTAQGQSLYAYTTTQCSCVLPSSLPTDTELTLQVASSAQWRDRTRPGEAALTVKTLLTPPRVTNVIWTADPDTDQVAIRFDSREDTYYHMYLSDGGTPELVEELTQGQAALTFGEGAAYPLPGFDGSYTILFDAVREMPGLTFYGAMTSNAQLCREDFLGTVLNLKNNDLGNNAWQLFWNETKGDHYEVQQLVDDQWQTVATVEQTAELTYHTGHLAKFKEFSFRVIAVGGQAEDIRSETLTVTTGAAVVYCTAWPQQSLEVYADETRMQVLGKVDAAKAFCVLEEKEGLFGIRYGDGIGYIDSNYCMINLPEYMEDLCAYDITNSYHSIYMVHDYEIPEVTDTVIKGYENVELAENEYLVPLLYPAAKKLVDAANAAREMGYVLKIYDSYRPRLATTSIYDLTQKILGDPIPEWTFAEKQERIKQGLSVEPAEPATEATEVTEGTGETVPPTTEEIITYEKLMTDNGRYSLANFLALGYSNHNLGVALDLTLISLYDGEEVEMQTAIHDLSWYSELEENNDAAKTLQRIMVGAGFGTLKSEWWHFQDNDAKGSLNLIALQQGVSPECWMADDAGWRYRDVYGEYYVNCREIIDGVAYAFDENGYATAS